MLVVGEIVFVVEVETNYLTVAYFCKGCQTRLKFAHDCSKVVTSICRSYGSDISKLSLVFLVKPNPTEV